MKLKNLGLRFVYNTKSVPTVEVFTKFKGEEIHASVPSGTSKGKYEVKYLNPETIVKIFPTVKRLLLSKDLRSVSEVDSLLHEIDGTNNFSTIGGNLALAISYLYLKLFAKKEGVEVFRYLKGKKVPKPLCNLAGGWGEQSPIQEYLVYPKKQRSIKNSLKKITEVYHMLAERLKKLDKCFNFGKNYESAWSTNLKPEKILGSLDELVKERKLLIGMDVAASDRWDGKRYLGRSKEQHLRFLLDLSKKFTIGYVEDPFHEDDFKGFATFLTKTKLMVCGDDLLATNVERLKLAVKKKAVNTVLVKPNQIGTVSDTMKFVKFAKKKGLKTVMSHRSGETDDALIAHLAVGLETDYAKFGVSGERVVKLNELIRIEEKLNS